METVEKCARAWERPLYQFFYDGEDPPKEPNLAATKVKPRWGDSADERRELRMFAKAFSRMDDCSRALALDMAAEIARCERTK